MHMRKGNCVPRLTVCVNNNCWLSRLLILISHFTHVQSFCPQVRAHLKLLPAWLPPSPPIIVIWWPVSWFRCVRFLGWPGPPALVRNNNTRHGGRRDHNQSSDWARRVTTAPTSAEWGVNHITIHSYWGQTRTSHTETRLLISFACKDWVLEQDQTWEQLCLEQCSENWALHSEMFLEKLSTKKSILITFSWVKLNPQPLQRKNC